MRIAAAQTLSEPGAVASNCAAHLAACRAAAGHGAGVVLFPELSLTGYELRMLGDHLLAPDDPALEPLRQMARRSGMFILAGAPVPAEDGRGVSIGTIVFPPTGATAVYRKRFLHPGEEPFAVPGSRLVHMESMFGFNGALAICADTTHGEHPGAARAQGADLYLPGVLWTPGGYDVDAALIQGYAQRHGLACLVANHGGPSGGFPSAGRSAFWAPGGVLMGTAPAEGGALVLADRSRGSWTCEVIALG
jgi:predicted amidohydrolase